MRATAGPVEANKIKLSIEVDEAELAEAIDATYRKLARQVRVPGFRPGKAPRKLLEARIGTEAVRSEALEDALPGFYEKAVRDTDVEPIAAPEIEVTAGRQEGPVTFDAVVEVRPQVNIAGYQGLQVALPALSVSDEEVDAQLDRLREQFGELIEVARPARDGDCTTIDVKAYRHSETIDELTADDYMYEVGSGSVVAELDDNVRGAKPGDIFKFNAQAGDEELSFQVLVKEVKEKVLPDVSDEWASEASEFDTLAELREDVVARLTTLKKLQARVALRDQSVEALSSLVSEDVPRSLVGREMERRLHDLSHRLEEQHITLEDYLRATGRDQAQLVAELEQAAESSVRADLALRALAEAESIEVADQDVDAEIVRMAEQMGRKAGELRSQLERADRLSELRSDMRSAKALDWFTDNVELVDPDGKRVDRAQIESSDEEVSAPQGEGGGLEEPETVESE